MFKHYSEKTISKWRIVAISEIKGSPPHRSQFLDYHLGYSLEKNYFKYIHKYIFFIGILSTKFPKIIKLPFIFLCTYGYDTLFKYNFNFVGIQTKHLPIFFCVIIYVFNYILKTPIAKVNVFLILINLFILNLGPISK